MMYHGQLLCLIQGPLTGKGSNCYKKAFKFTIGSFPDAYIQSHKGENM